MKKSLYLSLVASTMLFAASDVELSVLKDQVAQQQMMMNKLIEKIEKIEQKPAAIKQEKVTQDSVARTPFKQKEKTFFQAAYMPDISLIADFSYVSRDTRDDALPHLEVPGVAHGIMGSHGHDGNTHSPYNAKRGFNLNYAELGLSKSVDQTLKLDAIFHFTEDNVEIEEMYFTTTALGNGLRVKGGKFNSNFGYLNEQHHHYWAFADMPLVYESFLGMHGINENGLQVQWTAPTDTYLMFGAEVLQGENKQMFGNATIGDAEDPTAGSETAPSLFVGYAKTSFDIADTTVLAGLSYAKGSSRVDHSTDEEEPHAFAGDSELYGADLVVKHYFDSYSSLTWQSELLYRDMDGVQYNFDTAGDVTTSPNLRKKQAGLYSQIVYAPNKTWKMGARYDSIFKNDVTSTAADAPFSPTDLYSYSGMVEYSTSEFARFRLQYNHNSALYNEDENKQDVNSLILQVNLAIGAHGAHSF